MFEFEYDEAKQLWLDTELVEVPAKTTDELRCLVVGKMYGKHWSGVITYRGNRIRLISVRRSRTEEVEIYESSRF